MFLIFSYTTTSASNYHVIGKLTGFREGTSVYLIDKDSESILDSTTFNKGGFYLNGHLENGPMYLSIEILDTGNKYETVIFAGLGKVFISGNKNDFPYDVRVSGPPEQNRYNMYMNLLKPLNIKADAAWLAYTKENGDQKTKAALAYNAIGDQKNEVEKKWIFNHTNCYFSVDQLYNCLPELSKDTVQLFYSKLPVLLKKSIYGKRISNYLTKGNTLKINDKYTDFEAYDAAGKKMRLSAFIGKYILLDFSSVACGPCRASIEELRLLSLKYKDQLTIITYTLDKRSDWLQEIKDYHVTCLTVIDPEGNYSKTKLKYNIQSIPTFYLISPKGIIIDKWTGYEKIVATPGDLEKHLSKTYWNE